MPYINNPTSGIATQGVQSELGINSTTTTLGSSATFTGTAELNPNPDVMVSCYSDTAGTLYMDFSVDGTNWRTFPTSGFDVAAGIHEFHTAVKGPRYYRVRFVNGSDAQSEFQLYSYYGLYRSPNAPLNQALGQDGDSITVRSIDPIIEISAGLFGGLTPLNKFGRAPDGVQATSTDIWDRADATPTQQVWTAPTTARTHQITSTDTNDTSAGTGARTIRIFGLTSWSTSEISEDITMDGTNNVATSNSYVIIHRMQVLTKGASGPNVGTITATADTDSTVTAQINAGEGQTQMAIYGIPSTQTLYILEWYGSIKKAGGAVATIDYRLLVNPEPDAELTGFITKNVRGVQSTGTTDGQWNFYPYFKIPGPAIIKINGIASAADTDGSAGFDAIVVDN